MLFRTFHLGPLHLLLWPFHELLSSAVALCFLSLHLGPLRPVSFARAFVFCCRLVSSFISPSSFRLSPVTCHFVPVLCLAHCFITPFTFHLSPFTLWFHVDGMFLSFCRLCCGLFESFVFCCCLVFSFISPFSFHLSPVTFHLVLLLSPCAFFHFTFHLSPFTLWPLPSPFMLTEFTWVVVFCSCFLLSFLSPLTIHLHPLRFLLLGACAQCFQWHHDFSIGVVGGVSFFRRCAN